MDPGWVKSMPGDFGDFTVNIGLGVNFLAGGTFFFNSNDTLSYGITPLIKTYLYAPFRLKALSEEYLLQSFKKCYLVFCTPTLNLTTLHIDHPLKAGQDHGGSGVAPSVLNSSYLPCKVKRKFSLTCSILQFSFTVGKPRFVSWLRLSKGGDD